MHLYEVVALAIGSIGSSCCTAAVGTNFSDHWWSPGESGWGAAIEQQADVLFVQILVYGTDGSPVWYIASASPDATPVPGHSVYSGDLLRTSGPALAATFDPGAVSVRKVGALRFDADTTDTAILSYTVDGLSVSKPVTRLAWKLEDLNGEYYGGFVYDFSPTHGPCISAHFEDLGPLTIAQSGAASLVMTVQASARTCTFTGDYSQLGHMGTTRGTFICTQGGLTGTYTGFEMEESAQGISGRIVGETASCHLEGRFGGVRRLDR
jgi:hypothetical protein